MLFCATLLIIPKHFAYDCVQQQQKELIVISINEYTMQNARTNKIQYNEKLEYHNFTSLKMIFLNSNNVQILPVNSWQLQRSWSHIVACACDRWTSIAWKTHSLGISAERTARPHSTAMTLTSFLCQKYKHNNYSYTESVLSVPICYPATITNSAKNEKLEHLNFYELERQFF